MTAGFPTVSDLRETETDIEREGGRIHRDFSALISRTCTVTSDILYSRQATQSNPPSVKGCHSPPVRRRSVEDL